MRILLTCHRPLEEAPQVTSPAASHVRRLIQALAQAGHEISCVAGAGQDAAGLAMNRARVVQVDPLGIIPHYSTPPVPGSRSFSDLTDAELAAYRHAFRLAVDREVDQWNPDLIHAQHAGIHAQLALETG